MAANSIGNSSLVLSTNSTELDKGLKESSKSIRQWAFSAQTSIANAFKSAQGKAANFLGNAKSIFAGGGMAIGAAIGGPLGAALGSAIGGAAGGIVETVFEAVAHPFEKLDAFAKIKKQADALGVSSSQFQGLSLQLAKVGIDADQVAGTFATMGKNIADAAGGHGRAAPALKQLGIASSDLLHLPLDQQFLRLADAIAKLPPGAEQASAAMHIFGGQGAALLPILSKGGGAVQDFINQQKAFGAVLSDSQLKAAADASKAWKEASNAIKTAWAGLVNRATIIAAPIIQFAGKFVSKAFALLTPVFDWLGRVVNKTAEIITAVFEVFTEWMEIAVKWVKDLIGSWFSFGDALPSVESVVLGVFKVIGQAIGYVWDTLKAGAGVCAYVVGFQIETFGTLVDAFKEMIVKLLNLAGQLPDQLGGNLFRDSASRLAQFDTRIAASGRAIREWGTGAIKDWGSTANNIGAWFDRLGNRRREEQAAAAQVAEQLAHPPDYKGVAAVEKGSKEAYSIEQKFSWDAMFNKEAKEGQRQVEEQRRTNRHLAETNRHLGRAVPLRAG